MEFRTMRKVYSGRFIDRYDIEYINANGDIKLYEMISRDHGLRTLDDVANSKVDSVILIMTDESGEHILINKEFRLATATWVYNFPAGLIDRRETPEEAARRELHEETGLDIVSIDDTMNVSYSAVGFSNEKNICIVGKAAGTIQPSDSADEEIEAGWYTKEEVRELLKTQHFAARTQAYCYLWSKE